jgi:predicted PurR-regulated permease PerM
LIALAQGFTSAFALWVAGVDYFWFFFLICSFLSFIPLGAGVVTIPIAFILILSGDILSGLFIIAWVLLVVSTIDNFMRPRLVADGARLNSALMFLAVLSGLALFGFIGIVYGPIIMILIVTTLYVYSDYSSKAKRVGLYNKQTLKTKKAS